MFAHEPLIRVQGPLLQAQILETALLAILNFQTLVATKSARVCAEAQGDHVLEFGMRRAQGIEAERPEDPEVDGEPDRRRDPDRTDEPAEVRVLGWEPRRPPSPHHGKEGTIAPLVVDLMAPPSWHW